MTLQELMFGVEIEFVDFSVNDALDSLASLFRTGSGDNNFVRDSRSRPWQVVEDGSLVSDGEEDNDSTGELVTPPLRYNEIPLLQSAVRQLRNDGACINDTCGVHVHVGVGDRDFTGIGMARLANLVKRHEELLYQVLEVREGRVDAFCRKLPSRMPKEIKERRKELSTFGAGCRSPDLMMDRMKEIWYREPNPATEQHYHQTRYFGLNLHSYWYRGTIEYRFFNGSLHAGKIRAYVVLALALTAKAINGNGIGNGNSLHFSGDRKKSLIQLRRFLKNLRLSGEEFKNCRLHLLNGLLDKRKDLSCAD